MKVALFCIICSFVALSIGSALSESLTYDEVFYIEEGRRIWNTREFRDPYNPPLVPLITAVGVGGRWVGVVFGVILIIAVYRVGGIIAAALVAFEPTILANSHYVTNDIAVTLFIFLAATLRRPLLLGLSFGYALSSKMSSLVFLPLVLRPMRWRQLLGMAVVAFFVVWASYLFTWDVVIREREDAGRASVRLVQYARDHNVPVIEKAVLFLQRQPLPLGTYAATIKNNMLRFGKPSMVFFDGVIYDRSQWYFMVINVFRKLPLPLLILATIGAWYSRRFAAIGVGIVVVASFMGMGPLVRYVLPAVPFLAIVAAAGIRKKIFVLLLLWQIVGTILQYPHFISYANELVGPREKRYEVLADSNLDWGQALPDVMRWAKREDIGTMKFSYFGRDEASEYRFEDICAIGEMVLNPKSTKVATLISVSNWYYCGYNKEEAYQKAKIWNVIADSVLVF